MADPQAATPTGVAGIPDLNDPSLRFDRNSAMAAMAARRRETALADMEPEDAAALRALPIPGAAVVDEDASAGDAAAEAERARLKAEADAADAAAAAASDAAAQVAAQTAAATNDTATQLERQTANEPIVLDDDQLANYRARIKVNGVEEIVPLDRMRDTAQKNSAADRYLEEARATLSEMKTVAAQVAKQTGNPTTTAAAGTPDPSTTSSEPDALDAAVDSLFLGDEAKAKQLLRQAVRAATPQAATADPAAIARQVEQTLVVRSALRQFARDHKEIANDQFARSIADQYLVDEMNKRGLKTLHEADPDTVPELLNAAGKRTKDYFRSMAGVASPATTVALPESRRVDKAAIDEPPTAATRAASTVPTPPSTSDVIAQMREARNPLRQQPDRR